MEYKLVEKLERRLVAKQDDIDEDTIMVARCVATLAVMAVDKRAIETKLKQHERSLVDGHKSLKTTEDELEKAKAEGS